APEQGLTLASADGDPFFSVLLGFAPSAAPKVSAAQVLHASAPEQALSFYHVTSFPHVLGAPLVNEDGSLVALNAMRHPKDPGASLAIPLRAIDSFVREAQGLPADPDSP
ncbi:MAG: hypothetical protein AAGI01_01805, partial [Myxococcota bacterium]